MNSSLRALKLLLFTVMSAVFAGLTAQSPGMKGVHNTNTHTNTHKPNGRWRAE